MPISLGKKNSGTPIYAPVLVALTTIFDDRHSSVTLWLSFQLSNMLKQNQISPYPVIHLCLPSSFSPSSYYYWGFFQYYGCKLKYHYREVWSSGKNRDVCTKHCYKLFEENLCWYFNCVFDAQFTDG